MTTAATQLDGLNHREGSENLEMGEAHGSLAPIATNERVGLLDSYRGFALLGILMVNMAAFAWPVYQILGIGDAQWVGLDLAADWGIRFFAQAKFYVIFSFLFGVGMAIQMERCQATGRPFARFFAKRLFWLLMIGLVHAVLIWSGDILMTYALIGFGLLVFRNKSARGLMVWASAMLVLACLACGAVFFGMKMMVANGQHQQLMELTATQNTFLEGAYQQALTAMQSGTYADMVGIRIGEMVIQLSNLPVTGVFVLIAFMIGAAAWRSGMLRQIEKQRTFLVRFLMFALPIGLFGSAVQTMVAGFKLGGPDVMLGTLGMVVGQYALGYSYLAILALLYIHRKAMPLFEALAPLGRMALTNYLAQSVVCTLIFNNYGLGLAGQMGPFACLLLTLLIFAVQIPLSKLWLKHFRFGPMEWLWRSLTYGKFQRMSRTAVVAA